MSEAKKEKVLFWKKSRNKESPVKSIIFMFIQSEKERLAKRIGNIAKGYSLVDILAQIFWENKMTFR
jgi:hypothetical protein